MMLRNLLHEIVRRRLWPIPVVAVLVALAAPILFMKSAPAGAPTAQTPAPGAAPAGKLPARAQRLLAASSPVGSRGGASGSAQDPFQPPASQIAAAKAANGVGGATGASAKKASAPPAGSTTPGTTGPIPVVIQNADGTSTAPTTTPRSGDSGTSKPTSISASTASVDVRFGPSAGGRVHRAIPRLQTYFIHGELAAVFVKYSPKREAAVFAVAPGVVVSGPVRCRRIAGVCRYVDIPAGSYARLTTLTPDRIIVTRRLDVERIDTLGRGSATTATAAGDHSENACLLGKLRAMGAGDAPIARDACVQ
jgi:hypothetical protein